MNASPDHRETADRYRGEIVRQGRYRVILCRDGLQWIFQRRDRVAGARWRAVGYCVTREALGRLWAAHTGAESPELTALPHIVRGRNHE